MNLEQIDTSTTAGKAEVMRLAAEGRRVVYREHVIGRSEWRNHGTFMDPDWDWMHLTYAIVSEPVGPEEVWVLLGRNGAVADVTAIKDFVSDASNDRFVHYIRADLAGEGK